MNISNEPAVAEKGTLLGEEALEEHRQRFTDELTGCSCVREICVRETETDRQTDSSRVWRVMGYPSIDALWSSF
jgi:hypothetical protein